MSTTVARRIDHVAIAVTDGPTAALWYVEQLGMEIVSDEVIKTANVRLIALRPADASSVPGEDTLVQLAQPVGPGRIADFLAQHGEGLQHVCFLVDDTAISAQALGTDPGAVFVGGSGRPMCFLADRPRGVLVELAQPMPR